MIDNPLRIISTQKHVPLRISDLFYGISRANNGWAMVKKHKLYQRVLNNQKNIKINDFIRVVEAFGFVRDRITGSHHIYSHPRLPEAISIQPDKNNQAKAYQVRQFLRLVEKYNLNLQGD